LLVEYFIDRFGKKAGKKFKTINRKTLQLFQAYGWSGNVRELQKVIERAVILSDGDTFSVDDTWLKREPPEVAGPTAALNGALLRQEKEMIKAALAESHGRISGPKGAAARLGLPARTLDSKIKRLGINKYRFKSTTGWLIGRLTVLGIQRKLAISRGCEKIASSPGDAGGNAYSTLI
jgi:formate hydrogenlyase transcriptional activator